MPALASSLSTNDDDARLRSCAQCNRRLPAGSRGYRRFCSTGLPRPPLGRGQPRGRRGVGLWRSCRSIGTRPMSARCSSAATTRTATGGGPAAARRPVPASSRRTRSHTRSPRDAKAYRRCADLHGRGRFGLVDPCSRYVEISGNGRLLWSLYVAALSGGGRRDRDGGAS